MANKNNENDGGMHYRQNGYVRRASLALSLAVTIHLSWIGFYYIQLILFPSQPVVPSGAGGLVIIPPSWIPNAPQPEAKKSGLPSTGISLPVNPGEAKFGIPIPVPEPLTDPGDFIPGGNTGGSDEPGSDGFDGDAKSISIPENAEPSPDSVIIVEKNPVPVKMVTPEYPELARRLGVEGTVWVKILVDREGRAKKAIVIKSDSGLLNENATTAALGWLFTPAMMTNGPVMVWAAVPFRFTLQQHR
jgi:protein TonB